jgi:hypothetical protein
VLLSRTSRTLRIGCQTASPRAASGATPNVASLPIFAARCRAGGNPRCGVGLNQGRCDERPAKPSPCGAWMAYRHDARPSATKPTARLRTAATIPAALPPRCQPREPARQIGRHSRRRCTARAPSPPVVVVAPIAQQADACAVLRRRGDRCCASRPSHQRASGPGQGAFGSGQRRTSRAILNSSSRSPAAGRERRCRGPGPGHPPCRR